jgi:hypothetical protein
MDIKGITALQPDFDRIIITIREARRQRTEDPEGLRAVPVDIKHDDVEQYGDEQQEHKDAPDGEHQRYCESDGNNQDDSSQQIIEAISYVHGPSGLFGHFYLFY